VRETLTLYGRLYGLGGAARRARIDEVAGRLRITRKLDARMRTLSKGTLQRVAVAQAILPRPRLVILDEPMSGLDPAGRKEMRDLILSLKTEGTTVLFSSHILSDAEMLCDRVGVLAAGRLREVVDLRTSAAQPTAYTLVLGDVPAPVLETLAQIAGAAPGATGAGEAGRWRLPLPNRTAVQMALAALNGHAAAIEALVPQRTSLEQHFLWSLGDRGEDPDA
jgi:ABC-2 type transport system ATP-binding protein